MKKLTFGLVLRCVILFAIFAGILYVADNYIQSYLVPTATTDVQSMDVNGNTASANQSIRTWQNIADLIEILYIIANVVVFYYCFKPLYVPIKECLVPTDEE